MPLNKSIMKIFLLIIYLTFSISSDIKRKSFKELIDLYLGKLDINYAYLSYTQYISLLNTLVNDYPNYLEISSIGKTYEGNEIPLIIMKSPFSNNEQNNKIDNIKNSNNNTNNNQTNKIDNSLYNKSGVLFTGMHHGREPVSMMMNIYIILHLLSLPRTYLHLFLSTTNIYFIPIINIDTYKYNCQKYLSGKPIRNIISRKNRRPHPSKNCLTDDLGVDLNRNYDYFFAKDDEGSSKNPCQEDYRGEFPFSEPETKNIKHFVESHPNIKIVYNYHSWGNLVITPFNCLKNEESIKLMKQEFPLHYKMYEDFKKEGNFPQNFLFGNADTTIKYISNGEATDWFLGKQKILSFSPELGNGKKNSDVFYPDKTITFDILEKNLYGGLYAIQKSMYFLKGELISANYNSCQNIRFSYNDISFNKGKIYNLRNCFSDELVLNIKVKLTNKGFGDFIPRVEFPYFQNNNETNKGKVETNSNKKYFYFLAYDLKANLDKVKSLCFWITTKTLYTMETSKNEEKNQTKKNIEEIQYIGDIRCSNIKKESEINDIKLFIDSEIKSMEYIILNLQIVLKKYNFMEKISNLRKLNTSDNKTNNTNININDEELVAIYTKKERIIKSQDVNGQIIEWKFNNPTIKIKATDFVQSNNINNYYNKRKTNPYKILIIVICITFLLIYVIYRIIKTINGRNFHALLEESINGQRNDNNNNGLNMRINSEQIVNNLENANQNVHYNNEQILPVQIPRDENEPSNSISNSNSESPNQLNQ